MVIPRSLTGVRTTPKSKFCEVSGVRFLCPPNNPSPCVLQVCAVNGARGGLTAQFGFPCPMLPPVEAASEGGLFKAKSVGARKPVEAVARNFTKLDGCHATWIFGLLVVPKSL